MKKMIVQICAAMALLLSNVHAFLEPTPGQFVISGAYNYVDPRFAASPCVIEAQGPGSTLPNRRFSNNFDTKGLSGAEVGAKYGFPQKENSFISADWRTLQGDHVSQLGSATPIFIPVVTPPLVANPITVPFAGIARCTLEMCFNDVTTSWNCHLNPIGLFNFYVLAGVEYLQFMSEDTVVYISTTDTRTYENKRITRVHGVGTKVGADILYELYAPAGGQTQMSLHLGLSGSALVMQSKTEFKYRQSGAMGVAFDLSDQRYNRVVPMSQFKAGMSYVRHFMRFVLALEIGYDVTTYPNLIDAKTFTSQTGTDEGRTFDNFSTLALQGLYTDLSVRY